MNDTENQCLFCAMPPASRIADNQLAYAIRDSYPVTPLHSLVIPKRHVEDYFGLEEDELLDCNQLLCDLKEAVLKEDETVCGFNVGMNAGAVAGQTIFHCHIHLIPRREGDNSNPRGGVRGVIPSKADYTRYV